MVRSFFALPSLFSRSSLALLSLVSRFLGCLWLVSRFVGCLFASLARRLSLSLARRLSLVVTRSLSLVVPRSLSLALARSSSLAPRLSSLALSRLSSLALSAVSGLSPVFGASGARISGVSCGFLQGVLCPLCVPCAYACLRSIRSIEGPGTTSRSFNIRHTYNAMYTALLMQSSIHHGTTGKLYGARSRTSMLKPPTERRTHFSRRAGADCAAALVEP